MCVATPPVRRPDTLAVFDFDGTLTYGDTLLPFLARVSLGRLVLGMVLTAPLIAAYLLRLGSRERAKERLCTLVLRGCPRSDLAALAARWGPGIALRSALVQRLQWHRSQGHCCVLVSASPDVYLQTMAAHLGFDDLICTCLESDAAGRLTGRFLEGNCWGPEKLRRVQARYGPLGGYVLYAYGDSKGDQWLIDAADHAWYQGREIKP